MLRDTQVLEVPAKLALGISNAQPMHENVTRTARMASALLAERAEGSRSFWAPYVDVLLGIQPPPLERFVRFLQSEALEVAQAANAEFHRDLKSLRQGSPDGVAAWALSLVSTRSFKSNFVPMADFFNHRHDGAALEYDPERQVYRVVVQRGYEAGSGVALCYGSGLRDEELLARYRFAPPRGENPHRYVTVPWDAVRLGSGERGSPAERARQGSLEGAMEVHCRNPLLCPD